METPKTVLFEVRDHVAHITLNRPEVLNAMNLEMSREFKPLLSANRAATCELS